jgi:Zn-finger nucleic acid-binding protein
VTTATATNRVLVACSSCRRQYDAEGFKAGSRFHCACGEIIEVPRFRVHDAAVVRCSSCSAPRMKGTTSCGHCGADYTLHERDLHTICPSCMTRVSDRARYCHHCATPIMPQGNAGQPTKTGCPACGKQHKMNGRAMGDPPISVLECPRCAGLWLSRDAFKVIADQARDESVTDPAMLVGKTEAGGDTPAKARPKSFYRQCPECRKMMNRRNFGQRSGVVIDTCKEHGIWFDAQELGTVLRWIRQGGEDRAAQRCADEARHAERQARIKVERPTQIDEYGGSSLGRAGQHDRVGGFLGLLFDL